MTLLVDANVLSEATRPEPDPKVLEWLASHEREIVVREHREASGEGAEDLSRRY